MILTPTEIEKRAEEAAVREAPSHGLKLSTRGPGSAVRGSGT